MSLEPKEKTLELELPSGRVLCSGCRTAEVQPPVYVMMKVNQQDLEDSDANQAVSISLCVDCERKVNVAGLREFAQISWDRAQKRIS